MPLAPYTLEQAEEDIATLRGQMALLMEAGTKLDGGTVPNVPPSSGFTTFSSNGQEKYTGADGSTYNTGRSTIVISANQTINSSSNLIVGANSTPMSWLVGIGQYMVVGLVNWSQNATTSTAQTNGFTGPATSGCRIANNWQVATQFAQAGINTREASSLGGQSTPAYANGTVVEWYFSGVFTTTATGTVSIISAAPIAANTFVIGANSFASLFPIS